MQHISKTLAKIQAGEAFSPAELKRQIERNRTQERLTWQLRLQQLLKLSPEEAAVHLDRKCEHCGGLLIPWKGPEEWRGGEKWYWPDEHDCEAEKRAKEAREAQEIVSKQNAERNECAKRLRDAGLVGWLSEATFTTFKPRDDWEEAEQVFGQVFDYAATIAAGDREKPFLVLHGQYGNGKSHLAASVIRHFIDKGQSRCYFRVWSDYLRRIQASWKRPNDDEDHETEEDIISELQTGEVVVIDDLDKRRPTDWVREMLFPVLNHRYNAQLPTILTLNYGPEDRDIAVPGRLALEDYLGRAVLDRVIGSSFAWVEFNGPSYRSGIPWDK